MGPEEEEKRSKKGFLTMVLTSDSLSTRRVGRKGKRKKQRRGE